MLKYLTLSFTKAIFLAGTIIGFLSLTFSLIGGADLHAMYGLTLNFGWAGVLLSILAAFLSVINTILAAMLSDQHHKASLNRVPGILYDPDISLTFCMVLVIAANWCAALSALFFFVQYNRHMLYVLIGLVAFSFIGHGPLFSLAVVLFSTTFLYRRRA